MHKLSIKDVHRLKQDGLNYFINIEMNECKIKMMMDTKATCSMVKEMHQH